MAKLELQKVVKEYILESDGESSLTQTFPRYMQMAISCLRELATDVSSTEKEIKLTVEDNLTVCLPDDYIDYIAIGFCCDGRLTSMALNKNLCAPSVAETLCSCEESTPLPTNLQNSGFYGSYQFAHEHLSKNGEHIGKYYGLGGGVNTNGLYKIIEDEYIVFKNVQAGEEIVLRYNGSVDGSAGSLMVHPYEVEAVKSWIYWKKIQRKRNYSLGEKQIAQREYTRQKRLARNRHRELNVFEIVNAFAAGKKSSPKM